MKVKKAEYSFVPKTVDEGDGAKVKRIIGTNQLPTLDPFLMLDLFNASLPGGFPDHPHRGFETVTYQLKGEIFHEDFRGHKGVISEGGVQWMTAGKGIVHAEMPGSFDQKSIGFQLWINLQRQFKYIDPHYQEFKSEEIPVSTDNKNYWAKVIAGKAYGVEGPIYARTPALYLDITLKKGFEFTQLIQKNWNTLIYVHEGSIVIEGKQYKDSAIKFVLSNEDEHIIIKSESETSKFIIISGQIINEPVCWHGPFVLNTDKEVKQTIQDYQQSKNGFEGADTWSSQIKNMKYKNK